MLEKRPLVSVVMPAYNSEKYIEAAIASVQAQTMCDWELIVVDDASTDGTAELVSAFSRQDERILLLKNQRNLGAARSRNRAFRHCRGRYIALLDSDDRWHPEKLSRQLELARRRDADVIYTSYRVQNGAASADYIVPERTDFKAMLRENVIGCSTVLLKAELLEHYTFATDCGHEDYALWMTLLHDGKRACGLPEVLVDYRYHAGSKSADKVSSAVNRWRIYRDVLSFSIPKSSFCFVQYAVNGYLKYRKLYRGKANERAV